MEGAACAWPFLPALGALGDGVTHFPFLFPFLFSFYFPECIPLTGNKYQDQTLPGKLSRKALWFLLPWDGGSGSVLRAGARHGLPPAGGLLPPRTCGARG